MNTKQIADILLVSNHIFSAQAQTKAPFPGAVAIVGNKIAAIVSPQEKDSWIGEKTKTYNLEDQVICPGFLDNHVFFTGHVWSHIGADLSEAATKKEAIALLKAYGETIPEEEAILGHGLSMEVLEQEEDIQALLEAFGTRPVIGFTEGRNGCIMNRVAKEKYEFDETAIFAEKCYKVFDEFLRCESFIKEEYKAFSRLLASRGVTAIKEIGFNQYSGFTKLLKEFEDKGELIHRVNLVSQAVGYPMDYEYAAECRDLFQGDFVRFMGFNVMVDGGAGTEICSGNADLLAPYANNSSTSGGVGIDYEALEKAVLKADSLGFRCALHAEGDAAVRKTIDLFEKCIKVNGPRNARHVITDLELTDPSDLKRMKELGIIATNYVQMMSCLGPFEDFYGYDCVGEERMANYWNYRGMIDNGVVMCCGTDMPLTVPDIPMSVYLTVGRRFPEGKPAEGVNPAAAIKIEEILKAWTINGQYSNFRENELGTLEAGKLADIAVLDSNIFDLPLEKIPEVKISLTICDGKVVYEK
ncbi:MAG: amidohydrolase family protein [Lachnospiraceae bacterium]|nr:amidohydrolase family protein [Lachnospiraceae bacterium]